jgi:hypothetical protein
MAPAVPWDNAGARQVPLRPGFVQYLPMTLKH